jgi:hypothetical protein
MSDFVKQAERLLRTNQAGWAAKSFDAVFQARRQLQRASSKARVELDNIEHLFASFEMAQLLGRFADLEVPDIDGLVEAMRHVITRTLERAIRWPMYESGAIAPPTPYDAFAHLLTRVHQSPTFGPAALISFNYDLAIDYSLAHSGNEIDYGLAGQSMSAAIPLLKLHGSLNWIEEKTTGIRAIPLRNLVHNVPNGSVGEACPVDTQALLTEADLWPEDSPRTPFMIPPTWSKSQYQSKLLNVWRRAAAALAGAESIVIVGYSMPESDQFFRQFYSLSTMSDAILDRMIIVDPGNVGDNFRRMLGQTVIDRNAFRHLNVPFDRALTALAQEFEVPHGRLDLLVNRGSVVMSGDKRNLQVINDQLRSTAPDE